METFYIFWKPVDERIRTSIEKMGFSLDDPYSFRVSENDPRLQDVIGHIRKEGSGIRFRTVFSPDDLERADFLAIRAADARCLETENHMKRFRADTFCPECGAGRYFPEALELDRLPKKGAVFGFADNQDEHLIIVEYPAWQRVFSGLGIDAVPVERSGKRDERFVCLKIPVFGARFVFGKEVEGTLYDYKAIDHLDCDCFFERCRTCGIRKIMPLDRGMLPRLNDARSAPIQLAGDLFGGGGLTSFYRIVVTHEAYKTISRELPGSFVFRPLSGS